MPLSEYVRNIRAKIGHDLLLLVGCAAVVINEEREVLLLRRSDDGDWALPGGSIDPGETPAETVVREVYEESGVRVVPERIVGVYGGGDEWLHVYPNGDRTAVINIAFACRPVGGAPRAVDGEAQEVRYFPLEALPPLPAVYRLRIEHALAGGAPYFKRSDS